MSQINAISSVVQQVLQRAAFLLILLAAIGATIATALAALGVLPWLSLSVGYGDSAVANAGMWTQVAFTVFLVLMLGFLPSNARIMQLESSHRAFNMQMNDVARAYAIAHGADRSGVFKLSSEFDSVRERLTYLRDHPDLEGLEPDILEVAAQMSHISRELADVYSDEKVARAQDFLKERQEEVERFNKRLEEAKTVSRELSHWVDQVELEESVAASQRTRLKDELAEILPELGLEKLVPTARENVVTLSAAQELDRNGTGTSTAAE